MAEEIVGTIENVDRLFSEIIVNGESHVSERYVAPSTSHSSPSTRQAQVQGEDVHAVELNHVLHDFSDPDIALDVQALQQGLADETSARTTADQALSSDIAIEANARQSADTLLQGSITAIDYKIPAQASALNQLADKNFVNSSIATNTANFLGTYTSLADIEAIQNPTNNDYAFLQTTDSAGNNVFDRYKYNAEQDEWLFEYELNNSSFTAEQWATINSGLTQSSVTQEIENAINALDVAQVGGATKYIESISQVNGKIVAVEKTFASMLLDIAHPVGSLYWTSSSENPAVTFGGGTWTQIKDVFVWAKGDNDTVNATGGAKTVTLTLEQIPSHSHAVTASGTISVTTNPTFTGSEHSHSYTPAGSVSVTTNPTFTGSAVTSGGSSSANTGSESSHTHGVGTLATASSGAHTHRIVTYTADARQSISNVYPPFTDSTNAGPYGGIPFIGCDSNLNINDDWSNLPASGSGSSKVGYCRYTNYGGKHTSTMRRSIIEVDGAHTHSMSGTSGAGSSHSHTMAHTHSVTASGTISGGAYKFTGTSATLKATQGGTISGGVYTFTGSSVTSNSKGGGQAHSNMPPYVVKYCWERTA